MTRALTRRQREVLDAIVEFIRTKRYSPTLDEIAAQIGVNAVATVHKHVEHLQRKGYVRREFYRSRAIEVVPEHEREAAAQPRLSHCPTCRCEGQTPAGGPLGGARPPANGEAATGPGTGQPVASRLSERTGDGDVVRGGSLDAAPIASSAGGAE